LLMDSTFGCADGLWSKLGQGRKIAAMRRGIELFDANALITDLLEEPWGCCILFQLSKWAPLPGGPEGN